MLARIENIKKRRASGNKFLKTRAWELLRTGHHSDAFRKVEEIYQDQDRSLCYDFLERFCTLVLDQLTPMTNQRECPEECKEAVSSLMYAARRFGAMPELHKLNSLFYKKYWTSVESFVNKEFLDLLESDRPSIPDTIVNGLILEIAQENGLEDNGSSSSPHVLSEANNIEYEAFSFPLDGSDDVQDKEPSADIVKQTENRLRTTGLVSTSRKTSTTVEKSLNKQQRRKGVKSEPNKKGNSGAGFDIRSNNIRKHGIDDKEKAISFPLDGSDEMKNKQQRRGVKIHPTLGCLPDPVAVEEPKRTVNHLPKHVHPKLPDYDVLKARLQEIRRDSSISNKYSTKSSSLYKKTFIKKQAGCASITTSSEEQTVEKELEMTCKLVREKCKSYIHEW
ncbi:hypothetical protein SSX86_011524 [Deinandra increscens subsp. villosa]|uniref:Uncharacterized protein n=1 Tax=Deinandra increscens subsp. villosa TaxID=3103831 RepID=A0AAP0DB12_9ASTR